MYWRKKEKDDQEGAAAGRRAREDVYVRLGAAADGPAEHCSVPRGHVPVIVGGGAEGAPEERFAVHVRLFKDPCMASLLELGAEEFGSHQQGVLRIPCDVDRFRRILSVISKR